MQHSPIDEITIRRIVESYSDLIMRIAYQNTRNRYESEDIMQEVFVALIKKYPFSSEEHMKAWIIRVTINKCKNYLKSARRKVLPLKNNFDIAATVKSDDLTEELFELPEFERNVLFLHYYEGYSAREIGKMLHKSENAVFLAFSRARKHLKLIIEGELTDGN